MDIAGVISPFISNCFSSAFINFILKTFTDTIPGYTGIWKCFGAIYNKKSCLLKPEKNIF